MLTANKRPLVILSIIAILLSIPLVAMQFTDDVKWHGIDFLVAAILLTLAGLGVEAAFRFVKKKSHRIGLVICILIFLFLIWAELAVGIFGTPLAGS